LLADGGGEPPHSPRSEMLVRMTGELGLQVQLIGTNSTEWAGYFNQLAAIGAEINGDTRRLLDSANETVSLGRTDLRSNHLANSFAAFA
jgi:hypothetical protein